MFEQNLTEDDGSTKLYKREVAGSRSVVGRCDTVRFAVKQSSQSQARSMKSCSNCAGGAPANCRSYLFCTKRLMKRAPTRRTSHISQKTSCRPRRTNGPAGQGSGKHFFLFFRMKLCRNSMNHEKSSEKLRKPKKIFVA